MRIYMFLSAYGNRSLEDSRLIEKVNKIVSDRFPGFASRYFNHCMDTMTPNSLYNYALDMTVFFRYLESIDYFSVDLFYFATNKLL